MTRHDARNLILAGTKRALATPLPAVVRGHSRGDRLAALRAREEARHHAAEMAPYDPAGWLGEAPTNAERIQFHREVETMEVDGLLQRFSCDGSGRTTHVYITPAGRRWIPVPIRKTSAK